MFRGHRPANNWKVPFEQADMYFQVVEQKTYNRNQAIVWADGDIDNIKLYWMDEVWDQVDWSKPPTRSWADLMRERCWQVRDKADVLGVSYSGGYDSQTIVDHMIINRVPLDELQINIKRYHPHPEGETTPILAQKIKDNHYPNLRIRAIEIGLDYMLDIYRNYGEDWLFKQDTGRLHFTQTVRSSQVNHNQEHSRLLDIQRIVMCEGIEKPRLFIKDGWWVTGYIDDALIHTLNTPYEHFYISRDLPELHVKQVWMMIDWMESQNISTVPKLENFMHDVQKHKDNYIYEAWNLAVGRNPVHHVNSWCMEHSHKKTGAFGGMYSADAQMTLEHNNIWDLPEVKMWKATAESFIQQYKSAFVNDYGQTHHIWTKLYPIKPVEPGRTKGSVLIH
jgi:hypothetical protein